MFNCLVLINILIVEGPSTSTTVQPCIIDLTRSSSPPVRRTSPVPSHTYVDVGTSPDPVPSLLPLKEKPSALVRGKYLISLNGLSNDDGCWIASPRCGSDSSESFSSYPGRSSTHTFGTLFAPCSLFSAKHNYVAFFYLISSNNIQVYADPHQFL